MGICKRFLLASSVVLFSASSFASDFDSPRTIEDLVSLNAKFINGEYILLPEFKEGNKICKYYIETIQYLAYGENAYTLGKNCKPASIELKET